MNEISLTEIVEKYDSYGKNRSIYFYITLVLIVGSYFVSHFLPPVIFLIFVVASYINTYYRNIHFYKWLYLNFIKPERLLHSFRTRKLVENTFVINSCIRWALPADKIVLLQLKMQIEDIVYSTPVFSEDLILEKEYLIYREPNSWIKVIMIFSGFSMLISYSNAGPKYMLPLLVITALLLIPAMLFYNRRKKYPYLILSDSGLQKYRGIFYKWKDITDLHVEDESDSETTSFILILKMRSGLLFRIDVTDIQTDKGQFEIILKKFLKNSVKAKK